MNKSAHNPTLSVKQLRAIACLIECPTVEAAMKKAGVARTTFYAWIKDDPSFRVELHRQRGEAFEETMNVVKAAAAQATRKLAALIDAKDERVQLAACRSVLMAAFQAHEVLEVEERMVALEARIAEVEQKGDQP